MGLAPSQIVQATMVHYQDVADFPLKCRALLMAPLNIRLCICTLLPFKELLKAITHG